jgi:hypothetical protein
LSKKINAIIENSFRLVPLETTILGLLNQWEENFDRGGMHGFFRDRFPFDWNHHNSDEKQGKLPWIL